MATVSSPTRITPIAGFVVKSASLEAGAYLPPGGEPVPVPEGLKIFVNVAWAAAGVPPPPEALHHTLDSAVQYRATTNVDPSAISVFVSDGRSAVDKAGKPSLVFDAVFHSSLKSRTLKDPEFKLYLVELALQRIEGRSGLHLSRTLGAPNIASKGQIPPMVIPNSPDESIQGSGLLPLGPSIPSRPLIEEIVNKDSNPSEKGSANLKKPDLSDEESPIWSWTQEDEHIRLEIKVPKMTREDISSTTLDVEPQRLIFRAPDLYNLDIDLSASDSALQKELALSGAGPDSVESALTLKRVRPLDVDGASAEWRVAEGRLVVYV